MAFFMVDIDWTGLPRTEVFSLIMIGVVLLAFAAAAWRSWREERHAASRPHRVDHHSLRRAVARKWTNRVAYDRGGETLCSS